MLKGAKGWKYGKKSFCYIILVSGLSHPRVDATTLVLYLKLPERGKKCLKIMTYILPKNVKLTHKKITMFFCI